MYGASANHPVQDSQHRFTNVFPIADPLHFPSQTDAPARPGARSRFPTDDQWAATEDPLFFPSASDAPRRHASRSRLQGAVDGEELTF